MDKNKKWLLSNYNSKKLNLSRMILKKMQLWTNVFWTFFGTKKRIKRSPTWHLNFKPNWKMNKHLKTLTAISRKSTKVVSVKNIRRMKPFTQFKSGFRKLLNGCHIDVRLDR